MTYKEEIVDNITGNRWRRFLSLVALGMMIQFQST